MSGYWSKSVFERGWVTERKFQGNGASLTNDCWCWRKKTRVPGLSRGVVCLILCLAVLVQYRRACDGLTDRRMDGHDDGKYPR